MMYTHRITIPMKQGMYRDVCRAAGIKKAPVTWIRELIARSIRQRSAYARRRMEELSKKANKP